jgi:hypothetical protein
MEATFLTMHYRCKRCGNRWDDRVTQSDPTATNREREYELKVCCVNCAGKKTNWDNQGKAAKK